MSHLACRSLCLNVPCEKPIYTRKNLFPNSTPGEGVGNKYLLHLKPNLSFFHDPSSKRPIN
ncbi:hypothetical protein GFO_0180 [Christiangramia forsetii KT0803]|uniref:Uncharacterized protein n=1 Tax=Christiangramia forsetii (strain DSM 17595 / CGMCC 1.15422 / KT0803) TaxID=411154 RepID=A0LXS3_CHRFK|nr:hypothetical protein GFO_0180 [Christiangramia forsetii KT0803]